MKKVWKCDYCTRTSDVVSEMDKHEIACISNPANETCSTCKNNEVEWWGGAMSESCAADVHIDIRDLAEEGALECEKYILKEN